MSTCCAHLPLGLSDGAVEGAAKGSSEGHSEVVNWQADQKDQPMGDVMVSQKDWCLGPRREKRMGQVMV